MNKGGPESIKLNDYVDNQAEGDQNNVDLSDDFERLNNNRIKEKIKKIGKGISEMIFGLSVVFGPAATVGYVLNEENKKQDFKIEKQSLEIEKQSLKIEKQNKEIEDLKNKDFLKATPCDNNTKLEED